MNNEPALDADETAGPNSMVLVRVNGRTVPATTARACRVCQSPHRADIESLILRGYNRPAILRELEGRESGALPHPSDKSLRLHTDKHIPAGARTQAAILARRAEQLGDLVEEYGGVVVDHLAALDLVIHHGTDALQDGKLVVDNATLMKAIDLKHKIEMSVEGGIDANVWRGALMEHMRIAIEFIEPSQRAAFGRALAASPVLQAMANTQSPAQLTA